MKRSTIITVAVFVVLAAAVFVIDRKPATRGVERLDLSAFDTATVDHMTLSKGDQDLVSIVRDDRLWRLADGHLADGKTVDRAFKALTGLSTTDVVSTSSDRRAAFGVDDDKGLTISLAEGDKPVVRVVVGHNEKGAEFVRRSNSDTIFKAPESLSWSFPEDPAKWLKLTLIDAELDDVTRIDVERADGERFAIAPKADSPDWTITDESLLPDDFRFDGPGARAMANTVVTVRATKLIEKEPDATVTGLAGDHDRYTIVTDAGSTTLHLGNTADDGSVYARVDGRDALFVIPKYQAQSLRKGVKDLRDLRPMAVDPNAVSSFLLRSGDDEIRMTRDDGGSWTIDKTVTPPPDDFEFDPAAVDRFLGGLPSMAGTSVADVNRSRAGLDHPDPVLELTMSDGSIARLEFGGAVPGEKDTKVYAHGNADDHIYVMPAFRRDRLAAAWSLFELQPPPDGNPYANLDPQSLAKLPPEVRRQIIEKMKQEQQKQRLMQQLQQRADQ